MRYLILTAAFACTLVHAGCSINVRDDAFHDDTTSCSVKCPGKGKASVTCTASRTPACACEPTPTASCIESGPRSM